MEKYWNVKNDQNGVSFCKETVKEALLLYIKNKDKELYKEITENSIITFWSLDEEFKQGEDAASFEFIAKT